MLDSLDMDLCPGHCGQHGNYPVPHKDTNYYHWVEDTPLGGRDQIYHFRSQEARSIVNYSFQLHKRAPEGPAGVLTELELINYDSSFHEGVILVLNFDYLVL